MILHLVLYTVINHKDSHSDRVVFQENMTNTRTQGNMQEYHPLSQLCIIFVNCMKYLINTSRICTEFTILQDTRPFSRNLLRVNKQTQLQYISIHSIMNRIHNITCIHMVIECTNNQEHSYELWTANTPGMMTDVYTAATS